MSKIVSTHSVPSISARVGKYQRTRDGDSHHRFRAWEHCYDYFRRPKASFDSHTAGLHLGFYLASWGMLRPSGRLLQKSYTVHLAVVDEVRSERFLALRSTTPKQLRDRVESRQQLLDCLSRIVAVYKDVDPQVSVTDTLATKIMLGTLGCCPAFDRFMKNGSSTAGICPNNRPSQKSLAALADFYCDRANQFETARKEYRYVENRAYPPMKLLDMYLWQIGQEGNSK